MICLHGGMVYAGMEWYEILWRKTVLMLCSSTTVCDRVLASGRQHIRRLLHWMHWDNSKGQLRYCLWGYYWVSVLCGVDVMSQTDVGSKQVLLASLTHSWNVITLPIVDTCIAYPVRNMRICVHQEWQQVQRWICRMYTDTAAAYCHRGHCNTLYNMCK